MTTKMINLQEKQATITHTQSTAGYKAVRTIPSDKNTEFLSRHEASHQSAVRGTGLSSVCLSEPVSPQTDLLQVDPPPPPLAVYPPGNFWKQPAER